MNYLQPSIKQQLADLTPYLRRVAYYSLIHYRLKVTDDRVQECLLAACEGAAKFVPDIVGGCSLKTHACKSIRWRASNIAKAHARKLKFPPDVHLYDYSEVLCYEDDAEGAKGIDWLGLLRQLPKSLAKLMRLMLGVGVNPHSLRDASKSLNWNMKTTRRRYRIAVNRLRMLTDGGS